MRKCLAVAIYLSLTTLTANAQTIIAIGMTQQVVHARLGVPPEYWAHGALFPRYPRGMTGYILDAYPRRIQGRKYELLVNYKADENASRIHPPLVVDELRMMADKPVSVRSMLRDNIEVAQMCRTGCEVFSQVSGSMFEIKVRQKEPVNGRQLEIGFSAEDANTLDSLPVKTLEDLATMSIMLDYVPLAKYSDFENLTKIGSWPEN
jgi:hypothetical protein